MAISEADWKQFKVVRNIALERWCERVLAECQDITESELSAHERYGSLFGYLKSRNETMVAIFDDSRRSTAVICLSIMKRHGLITDEELDSFSPELQKRISVDF